MKLSELRDIVRDELDDATEPYLWSDAELDSFAIDAQNQAARRARLFRDSMTGIVCQIELFEGEHTYPIDPRVIRIDRAAINGRPLSFCLLRDIDCVYPGWQNYDSGEPRILIPDWETQRIRIFPTPDEDGEMWLTVIRTALEDPTHDEAEFEVSDRHCAALRHWVIYRALMKRDSEARNEEGAAQAKALFAEEFGPPQPAYDEVWIQQHYAGHGMGHY